MPIITFWNTSREQTGQTMSAIVATTHMAITQNHKILLISTSLNDDTMKNCFWHEKKSVLSGIFGSNVNIINQNGIEGLDRVVRSNRISPTIIKDYTKIVLKNRLEVLVGMTGTDEQFTNLCRQYQEIIVLAAQYYDYVFVDLDRNMSKMLQKEILKRSDVIVPVVSQRPLVIKENTDFFTKVPELDIKKAVFTLGKYDDRSKYNSRNISRSLIKTREQICAVPYNTLVFEAAQEGKIVDLLLDFSRLKGKDENTLFLDEINNLIDVIKYKASKKM